MNRIGLTILILLSPVLVFAQERPEIGFPFGKITYAEMDANSYPADTTADAYVMREYGEAHIDYSDLVGVIFRYHVKIKVLRASAVNRGDVEIRLYPGSTADWTISSIQASSFTLINNSMQESKIEPKDIFKQKSGGRNVIKFAIPNIQVGTIIEYQYKLYKSSTWTFKKWEFQSDIPKVKSEYVTTIPANYSYNVTLRGNLDFKSHETSVLKTCYFLQSGGSSECTQDVYVMENVPAFKKEEFMIAEANFISSLNFELAEIRTFGGKSTKYTREWSDVDRDLDDDKNFGGQLRKGKEFIGPFSEAAAWGITDSLEIAKKIYNFIKIQFQWDGDYGYETEHGIKKAFEMKTGNTGDINLALTAALQHAGLNAAPVLLATHHLERPAEIYPVLGNFNYVIVRLVIGEKQYLLDAVEDMMPFGSIPRRCYNGKGRVMAPGGSYWLEIKHTDIDRIVSQLDLKLGHDGLITGSYTHTYYGYASIDKRMNFHQFSSEQEYLGKVKASSHAYEITNYQRTSNDSNLSEPIVEKFEIQFSPDQLAGGQFLFNPHQLTGFQNSNPFKTETRQYPIDFGVPIDRNLILAIEYPESYEVISLPDKLAIALPNAGGRCLYAAQTDGKKLTVNMRTTFSKPAFSPAEYPLLRELYARRLQAVNTDIIFKKK